MKLTTGTDVTIKGSISGNVIQSALTQEQIIVLAMKQYASPFSSTFKELLSNALDAHHVAGVYSTPVDIFVDEDVTTKTIRFRFRDYGSGMDKDFLANRYFSLGDSTKREDARQTGSFGLGAKAGLIISPAMKVTTYTGDHSHTVIGQLVDGKQIVCSPVVTEPCSELKGTMVELTITRSHVYKLASDSSTKGKFDLDSGLIMQAIQRTAVVGFITGVDNAPRVRVTSNANYMNCTSHSGHHLLKFYNRSRANSLFSIVRDAKGTAVSVPNMTIIDDGYISRPDFTQLDDETEYWLWQDSFYKLAEGLAARIRNKTYKVDNEELTFSPASNCTVYWSIEPSVVFDISSDRTSINDTERNSEIIIKMHRNAIAAMFRKLKDSEADALEALAGLDPFSVKYRELIKAIDSKRAMLKQFNVKYVRDTKDELTAVMKQFHPHYLIRASDYVARMRYVNYESKRIDHGTERLLPVVLVAEQGKNKPSHELIKQAVEVDQLSDVDKLFNKSNRVPEYKAFLVKCAAGNIQSMIARIKAVVPKSIAVLSVDEEVINRKIDLTVVRTKSSEPKVRIARNKTSEMVLYRTSSYMDPKDFAYQYEVSDTLKEHVGSRRLPTNEFTYVRIKGFDIDYDGPSRYLYHKDWKTLDSVSAAFGRHLLFLRGDVDVKELSEANDCKLVEFGTYMMNFYRTNVEAARRYRLWQVLMDIAHYPTLWVNSLREDGIDVRKLLKASFEMDFDETRMMRLIQWKKENSKISHSLNAKKLANILGYRHVISDSAVIWLEDVWRSNYTFNLLESAIEKHWPAEVKRLQKLHDQFTSHGRLKNITDNYSYAVSCSGGPHERSLTNITSRIMALVRQIKQQSCAEHEIQLVSGMAKQARQNKKGRKLLELALARYFAW